MKPKSTEILYNDRYLCRKQWYTWWHVYDIKLKRNLGIYRKLPSRFIVKE